MKFKVSFAQVVNEAQLVEVLIDAESEEAARDKFSTGDFNRYLVVRKEANNITSVGEPEFKRVA